MRAEINGISIIEERAHGRHAGDRFNGGQLLAALRLHRDSVAFVVDQRGFLAGRFAGVAGLREGPVAEYFTALCAVRLAPSVGVSYAAPSA